MIQEKHWTKEDAIRAARLHKEVGEHVYIIASSDAGKPCWFVEDGTPLIRTWEKLVQF